MNRKLSVVFGQNAFQFLFKQISFGLILCFAAAAQAAPGDLDATFGGTGKIRTVIGGGSDSGNGVVRQSDGKLVVAGTSFDFGTPYFSLVRYNTNGTLDATFGTGGKVVMTLLSGVANAAAIVTEGGVQKILAAGYSYGTNRDFMVAKFNPNGTLDASFDGNGILLTDFGEDDEEAEAIAIQTDGKIVVVGDTDFADLKITVARYNTDGSLDNTFDADGKLEIAVTGYSFFGVTAVGIQNGKIVIAGAGSIYVTSQYPPYNHYYNEPVILRYNSNGTPDTSFSGDGRLTLSVSNTYGGGASSITFLSLAAGEDRIVVAGNETSDLGSYYYLSVWMLDSADGTPDSTFDGDGKVSTGFDDSIEAGAVKVQLNNFGAASKIVASGIVSGDCLVARYSLNGSLDTTFDGDGTAITDLIDSGGDVRAAMLIQPSDNKIVVASSSNADFAVLRYNTNGALDASFSGDGIRTDDIGNASNVSINSVAIQSDGKIVAAGGGVLTRFNSDGSFDTSFDEDGKVSAVSRAAAIQPNGKIVVIGSSSNSFTVARYNADGSPDTSFDADGTASAAIGTSNAVANAVAIQPDGAIVVAGYATVGSGASANIDFAVVRFLSNGAIDSSFDVDGKLTTAVVAGEDKGNAVAIQPDGKIIVAGSIHNGTNLDFGIVRYNPDGSLDTTFSFDGKQTTVVGAGNDVGNSLAIQSNKIIVAGYASNGSNNDFAVVRYNSDGSLDNSFDSDGKNTTAIGSLNDVGNAAAIQTNGKIVVAGSSETAANVNDFAVVRYNADGTLDNSFWDSGGLYGAGGKVTLDFGGNDTGKAVAVDSFGRAIVVGQANGLFGLARLRGDYTPTAASVTVSGRVFTPSGRGLMNAVVSLTDAFGDTRTTHTNSFGYYRFDEIAAGQTCVFAVSSKRYQFEPRIVATLENIEELNFAAEK